MMNQLIKITHPYLNMILSNMAIRAQIKLNIIKFTGRLLQYRVVAHSHSHSIDKN